MFSSATLALLSHWSVRDLDRLHTASSSSYKQDFAHGLHFSMPSYPACSHYEQSACTFVGSRICSSFTVTPSSAESSSR